MNICSPSIIVVHGARDAHIPSAVCNPDECEHRGYIIHGLTQAFKAVGYVPNILPFSNRRKALSM